MTWIIGQEVNRDHILFVEVSVDFHVSKGLCQVFK